MSVYAEGLTDVDSGQCYGQFDIDVVEVDGEDELHFVTSVTGLVNAASKMEDDVKVKIDETAQNKLTFTGKAGGRQTISPFIQRGPADVAAAKTKIDSALSGADHANSQILSVTADNLNAFERAAIVIKQAKRATDFIYEDTSVKNTDESCIFEFKCTTAAAQKTYVPVALVPFMADGDDFDFFGDEHRTVYFKKGNFRACLKMRDRECLEISIDDFNKTVPTDGDRAEVVIDGPTLLKALLKFDGAFDQNSWYGKPVYFRTADDDLQKTDIQLGLTWDDLKAEVKWEIPAKVNNDGGITVAQKFVLRTEFLTGPLKKLISDCSEIKMQFDAEKIGVRFAIGDEWFVLAKMDVD